MRSTAYLGIALGMLFVAAAALADDNGPSTDSLAQMPPNPVTSPTTADKDAPAAAFATAANERHHGHDKQSQHGETVSTAQQSGTAAPAPTSAAAASEGTIQPPAQPKKICRSMDVLGSKIPKRVCATQEEWATFNDHQHEDSQDALRRLRNQGANAPASPGVSASQLPP